MDEKKAMVVREEPCVAYIQERKPKLKQGVPNPLPLLIRKKREMIVIKKQQTVVNERFTMRIVTAAAAAVAGASSGGESIANSCPLPNIR